MRLADSTVDWIEKDLPGRYYGAARKEGLPHVWALRGVAGQMAVAQRWRYAPGQPDVLSTGPIDPGIHGGKIVGTTKGTPLNPPQIVERAVLGAGVPAGYDDRAVRAQESGDRSQESDRLLIPDPAS